MTDNAKICCFSGHRQISPDCVIRLPALLDSLIDALIEKGYLTFRAGGAVGFDTICALKVLEMKKKYPSLDVRLELCLPCPEQASFFSDTEKAIYSYVLAQADDVRYASNVYRSGCMYHRNRMLVDGAQLCVAYLTSSKGGTAYTASYALEKGLEFINVYDMLKNNT